MVRSFMTKNFIYSLLRALGFFAFISIPITLLNPLMGASDMVNTETTLDYDQREVIVKKLNEELTTNWSEGFSSLKSYGNHESEVLKRDLFAMAWRFALSSKDPLVRHQLILYLLDAVIQETPFLQGQAINFLQDFLPSDFNKLAVEKLEALSWSGDYSSEIIRLIGIVDVRSKETDLQEVAEHGWKGMKFINSYASQSWSASLVLARFGNIEYIQRVTEQVKAEPDIVFRSTRLFTDLAYTQQQLAFEVLKSYLHSADRLPPVRRNELGEPVALRAAELFASHVDGCPRVAHAVTEDDIITIRRWADQQKKWNIRK